MKFFAFSTIRSLLVLLISGLLLAGCSGSSVTPSIETEASTDINEVTENVVSENEISENEIIRNDIGTNVALESVQATLTLVADKTFRISWEPSQAALTYRILENPDGVSGFTQISGELDPALHMYDHRVALFKRTNARYIVQACNATECLDSNELIVSGTLNDAIGFVQSNYSGRNAFSGGPVSLSADGNTMAVGAPRENESETGAVYLFELIDGTWQQQLRLEASNAEPEDRFGRVVSLSADGNTLAVGTLYEDSDAKGVNGAQDNNAAPYSGAVYVFKRGNGDWPQQAYLKASNSEVRDFFGSAVSLSFDGNTLAVGARGENSAATGVNGNQSDNTAAGSGAVYIFVRVDDVWQQQAYLKPVDTAVGDGFGNALALSADGNTLAASHPGSVHVFERNSNEWSLQDHLQASVLGMHGSVGLAITLSGDGNTLAVGAPFDKSPATGINGNQHDPYPLASITLGGRGAGAAYVFVRSNGSWIQQAYVKASNTDIRDEFGTQLTLSADGNTLAVGAYREGSHAVGINGDQSDNAEFGTGAVYLYVRDSVQWRQQAYIKSTNSELASSLGARPIGLSADGNTLAVSSNIEDSERDETYGGFKYFVGVFIY